MPEWNNKEIKYPITAPLKWIQQIHQLVPSTLSGNQLILKDEVGQGTIEIVPIQEGLGTTFIKMKLNSAVRLIREMSASNDYFILNFYFSEAKVAHQITTNEQLDMEHCGILLSSAMTESESILPPNLPLNIFNITFSKEWLQKNVLNATNNSEWNQLLALDRPIYLFEHLDYKFNQIYKSIQNTHKTKGKIWLVANILNMLTHFFEKLQQRSTPVSNWNINGQDVTSLLTVKDNIEHNWQSTPSNENLAKLAGMSLSKFKRLFKQVFGKSPYQYYLAFKMDKAMELLVEKEYSVSDVGYFIGYSNLSQFSKAFKKYHKVLPVNVNKR